MNVGVAVATVPDGPTRVGAAGADPLMKVKKSGALHGLAPAVLVALTIQPTVAPAGITVVGVYEQVAGGPVEQPAVTGLTGLLVPVSSLKSV